MVFDACALHKCEGGTLTLEPLGFLDSTGGSINPPSDFARHDQIYVYMVCICSYARPLLNFIISTIFDEIGYHGNPRPNQLWPNLLKIIF